MGNRLGNGALKTRTYSEIWLFASLALPPPSPTYFITSRIIFPVLVLTRLLMTILLKFTTTHSLFIISIKMVQYILSY